MKFRSINFFRSVSCVLLASLTVLSCGKESPVDEPDDKEQQTSGYNISLETESEFYQVEFPQTSEPGEEVIVKVTPVENVFVDEVRFNNRKASDVEGSENTFRFTMPERDVTLAVVTSSTITVEQSDYFSGQADMEVAQVGETVTVTFVTLYADDIMQKAMVNDKITCTFIEMDLGIYTFQFKMPEGPAVVTGHLEKEYHVIERESDDHSVIGMLDCINHQGTPQEYCSQVAGKLVHFKYTWDLGYDVECKVTGINTGTDYTGDIFWSLAADNHLYQDCWAFIMPDEPVLIKVTSTEKNTYAGQPFTGSYKGYWITLGSDRIITSSQTSFNLDLSGSAAYFVTSTDENAYDFSGLYSVADGQLTYDSENCRGDHALRGNILDDGYVFAIVDYLLVDNVTNRKYYLAGKEDFEYVCASDTDYGTRFLIEANDGVSKKWYFVDKDNNSIREAQVSFNDGNSLGESCEAVVTVPEGILFNGVDRFKYTYQPGETPVFTYHGKEAGTYTSDKGETLVLDGFNGATFNSADGTYTIDDGLVTFTAQDGKQTKMLIDASAKTFKVVVEASEDTLKALSAEYSTTTAQISVNGEVSNIGEIVVAFDKNYWGDYYKDYAQIKITYYKNGSTSEIVGTCEKYTIDESTRTVTIREVVQGDGVSYTTIRKDIVFKISDDSKTLTLLNDYVYSSSPYEFCIGGAVLTAVE